MRGAVCYERRSSGGAADPVGSTISMADTHAVKRGEQLENLLGITLEIEAGGVISKSIDVRKPYLGGSCESQDRESLAFVSTI